MSTKNAEAPNGTAKKRKPAAKKAAAAPRQEPTQEEIARLAEKFWAERGFPQGSPEQDWLRAEEVLRAS